MSKIPVELATGLQLHRSGRLSEAEQIYARVLRTRPDDADVLCLLGAVRLALGNHGMAASDLRGAIRCRPDYPEAHNNLGIALTALGRLDDAEACLRTALRLRPGYPEALNNLGTVLRDRKQFDEAEASFREALRLKPDYAEAHMNLGVACAERGAFDEAIASYEQALRIHPGSAATHMNLGNALRDRGELDAAESSYQTALRIQPEFAEAHFHRALGQLLRGDYAAGWQGYEWRSRCPSFPRRSFVEPTWDGRALAGRTILLHAEQGLGDVLQFIRYAPQVKERDGIVVVECPAPLRDLLGRTPGIDRLIAQGDPLPRFDVQAPLLSLPRIMGTTLATIPAQIPYVFPDPEAAERWQRELAGTTDLKVGICWQGNPNYPGDRQRSFPLDQLAPLARLPGVRLFGLQKGYGRDQIPDFADRFDFIDLGHRLDESTGAFVDTAAVLKSLDLVIAPNTAIAHLAGAMGVPLWLALPDSLEWRWMVDREDSPWYPTVRLFRRAANQGWDAVFERMAGKLWALASARGRPISVEISPGELIDKITILQIKSERIADPSKLAHIRRQLAALTTLRDREIAPSPALATLSADLKALNDAIWLREEELRECEQAGDFGARFVELARSVYRENDRRAALKRKIDEHLNSSLFEVKSYPDIG